LPLLLVGCFNFVTVPGNLLNGLLVDHIGRRKFVITGCFSLCIILSVEAALTAQFAETGSTNRVGLGFGVAFIFLFPVFYSICLDATMYLIPAEIFPMIIRSFGISWSIMGQWVATTILLGAAPTAFEDIGYKFWIVLIICGAIYGILVYFFLPETKGKTLEEISIIFGDPVGLTDVEHFTTEELKGKHEEARVEYVPPEKQS
jgi:MFS family permease